MIFVNFSGLRRFRIEDFLELVGLGVQTAPGSSPLVWRNDEPVGDLFKYRIALRGASSRGVLAWSCRRSQVSYVLPPCASKGDCELLAEIIVDMRLGHRKAALEAMYAEEPGDTADFQEEIEKNITPLDLEGLGKDELADLFYSYSIKTLVEALWSGEASSVMGFNRGMHMDGSFYPAYKEDSHTLAEIMVEKFADIQWRYEGCVNLPVLEDTVEGLGPDPVKYCVLDKDAAAWIEDVDYVAAVIDGERDDDAHPLKLVFMPFVKFCEILEREIENSSNFMWVDPRQCAVNLRHLHHNEQLRDACIKNAEGKVPNVYVLSWSGSTPVSPKQYRDYLSLQAETPTPVLWPVPAALGVKPGDIVFLYRQAPDPYVCMRAIVVDFIEDSGEPGLEAYKLKGYKREELKFLAIVPTSMLALADDKEGLKRYGKPIAFYPDDNESLTDLPWLQITLGGAMRLSQRQYKNLEMQWQGFEKYVEMLICRAPLEANWQKWYMRSGWTRPVIFEHHGGHIRQLMKIEDYVREYAENTENAPLVSTHAMQVGEDGESGPVFDFTYREVGEGAVRLAVIGIRHPNGGKEVTVTSFPVYAGVPIETEVLDVQVMHNRVEALVYVKINDFEVPVFATDYLANHSKYVPGKKITFNIAAGAYELNAQQKGPEIPPEVLDALKEMIRREKEKQKEEEEDDDDEFGYGGDFNPEDDDMFGDDPIMSASVTGISQSDRENPADIAMMSTVSGLEEVDWNGVHMMRANLLFPGALQGDSLPLYFRAEICPVLLPGQPVQAYAWLQGSLAEE